MYGPRMAFRSEDYVDTGERTWLDRPDAVAEIERRVDAGELTRAQADKLAQFNANGFTVLENIFDHQLADEIAAETRAIAKTNEGAPVEEVKSKYVNTFLHSDATRRGMCFEPLLEWLDLILGMRAMPYQSLTWPVSSQIGVHADSILMTSHPRDTFVAAWITLADVTPDCGPVFGVPGSHRWPYVSAEELGIPRGAPPEECARIHATEYYPRMERAVEESGVTPYTFLGRKGDVLIWHSNLLHGARPVERAGAERYCMVVHYFGEHCESYSDLFQRALPSRGLR